MTERQQMHRHVLVQCCDAISASQSSIYTQHIRQTVWGEKNIKKEREEEENVSSRVRGQYTRQG